MASFVSGKRAVDISEISHQNVAWQTAIRKGNGTPINMVLALDQVAADDPWLDEPVTEQERATIDAQLASEKHPL